MPGITQILLISSSLSFLVGNHQTLNAGQEECFATSMIGYDYVINSRAGLPIERALKTVSVDVNSNDIRDTYKYYLKEVVHNAYRWQGTPHSYAVKVMFSCAFQKGKKESVTAADI